MGLGIWAGLIYCLHSKASICGRHHKRTKIWLSANRINMLALPPVELLEHSRAQAFHPNTLNLSAWHRRLFSVVSASESLIMNDRGLPRNPNNSGLSLGTPFNSNTPKKLTPSLFDIAFMTKTRFWGICEPSGSFPNHDFEQPWLCLEGVFLGRLIFGVLLVIINILPFGCPSSCWS